jgi:hypothetical protein
VRQVLLMDLCLSRLLPPSIRDGAEVSCTLYNSAGVALGTASTGSNGQVNLVSDKGEASIVNGPVPE